MKLKEYLKKEKLSVAKFAQKLSCHPQTITRYYRDVGNPSPNMAKLIEEATNGEVKFEDLFIVRKTKCPCPVCGKLRTVEIKD